MLDKKELNSMELDMVAGGNIFEDFSMKSKTLSKMFGTALKMFPAK